MAGKAKGAVRVGIGGWTYEPWRGVFYPKGLAQKRELTYAAEKLTSIEINGTFYGSQKPESFARWRDETPDGFVFALKGPRFATNRRVLAEAGSSVDRFFSSGVTELGSKLGPVNWQFAATKRYDPEDFEAFLALLPKEVDGLPIRHAVEVRHESFKDEGFVALARRFEVAVVIADSDKYPAIHDATASYVYARLQSASEDEPEGYRKKDLDAWAGRAKAWASGGTPDDLDLIAQPDSAPASREVFVYMINGFKPKAPAAAMALIERVGHA